MPAGFGGMDPSAGARCTAAGAPPGGSGADQPARKAGATSPRQLGAVPSSPSPGRSLLLRWILPRFLATHSAPGSRISTKGPALSGLSRGRISSEVKCVSRPSRRCGEQPAARCARGPPGGAAGAPAEAAPPKINK